MGEKRFISRRVYLVANRLLSSSYHSIIVRVDHSGIFGFQEAGALLSRRVSQQQAFSLWFICPLRGLSSERRGYVITYVT